VLKTAANRPYVVFGRTYVPTTGSQAFKQRGVASWYGRKFHGQKTSSGELYDMYGMSAAHPTLPIPSYVRVTNLSNGRTVVVRVNDRGPFLSERVIDLSYTAALKLGYVGQGSTQVEIEQVRANSVLPPVMLAAMPPAPLASAPAAPPTPITPPTPTMPPMPPAPAAAAPAAAVVVASTAVTPVADLAPVPLPTSNQPDGIYLQLGAFGAREGAEEFRIKVYQQLSWLTETAYIVARDRLFRVQLGPYKDRTEAAGIAEKIRQALQFKPMFILK
jgi:rare lipoprotein A